MLLVHLFTNALYRYTRLSRRSRICGLLVLSIERCCPRAPLTTHHESLHNLLAGYSGSRQQRFASSAPYTREPPCRVMRSRIILGATDTRGERGSCLYHVSTAGAGEERFIRDFFFIARLRYPVDRPRRRVLSGLRQVRLHRDRGCCRRRFAADAPSPCFC